MPRILVTILRIALSATSSVECAFCAALALELAAHWLGALLCRNQGAVLAAAKE
jgi:hypothetical protein